MSKLELKKLERFFHDLEKWNRVVIKDAQCPSDDGFGEASRDPNTSPERHTFIRVSCDLDADHLKPDAKLA